MLILPLYLAAIAATALEVLRLLLAPLPLKLVLLTKAGLTVIVQPVSSSWCSNGDRVGSSKGLGASFKTPTSDSIRVLEMACRKARSSMQNQDSAWITAVMA